MPYKRKIKTTKKPFKRFYKKKPTPFGNSTKNVPYNTVNLGLGFPKKMLVKQKYQETITLTSTSGALASYLFRLNSLYDPNYTSTGHQPMYFDQFMALYNHYTVIGCKMVVRMIPFENNGVPMKVCLWQNDDTTVTPSSFSELAEQSKSQTRLIGSDGSNQTTLRLNWSARKTFGKNPLENFDLRGNSGANPTEQSLGTISVQAGDELSTVAVLCQVYMEFISVYTELKDISGS